MICIYIFIMNDIFNLIYSIRAKQSSLHLFSSPNPASGDLLVVVDSGLEPPDFQDSDVWETNDPRRPATHRATYID